MYSSWTLSDDFYGKPSKEAARSLHKLLSDDNFEDLTRFRWRLITKYDVIKWTNEDQVTVYEGFSFRDVHNCEKSNA